MVKDLRSPANKSNIQQNLRSIIEQVTQRQYKLSVTAPMIKPIDREPDFYISPSVIDPFNEDGDQEKLFNTFEKENNGVIEVYVRGERDILLQTPKGDEVGLKVAQAYEEKFGKNIITLEQLPPKLPLG